MGKRLRAFSDLLGANVTDVAASLRAPLFCLSTFFNLQGLMSSMLSLGRIQVVPDSRVVAFVADNRVILHSVGWCLIPAVASLATALVCAVAVAHGEPTASIAFVSLVALGTLTTYQTFALGYSTELQCLLAKRASEKHMQ